MTDDTIDRAREALGTLSLFKDLDPARTAVTRLGGLTNLVFRIEHGGESFCLRLPGQGTEEFIDRKVEAHNARVAADLGVSAEVLYADAASGIMVTRFLDGAETMSPEIFRAKPGAPARAAEAFRKLHTGRQSFEFRFELFAMIDDYLKILAAKQVDFPGGYAEVLKEAEAVREALAARPGALAPCHCDPLCENFLDTGTRMWIVDWEYSGMNDPMWDLGDLSVEAGFEAGHDEAMMNAYFPGGAGEADWGRMVIYKAMCDLLWTLWGLIQHANDNPAEDFWAYATGRFARCKTLMAAPAFAEHLRAVRRG